MKTCTKYGSSRTALIYKKDGIFTEMSHSELKDKVECLALGMMELGIRAKDRVGIIGENRLEWIIADFAIGLTGAVIVPVFPTLSSKQEEFIYNDCEASTIFVSNSFQLQKVLEFKESLPSLRHIIVMNDDFKSNDLSVKTFNSILKRGQELKSEVDWKIVLEESVQKISEDDLTALIYTSGTTGNPKGVMLTNGNIAYNMIDSSEAVVFNESDLFLSYLPWCHSYERMVVYTAFYCGSTIAIAESIESVASNMKELSPTLVTTVPRLLEIIRKRIISGMDKESPIKQKIFNWSVKIGKKYILAKVSGRIPLLLNQQFKLTDKLVFSKIRERFGGKKIKFVSGGAALSDDVWIFFLAVGFDVLCGYGLTEASPVVSVTDKTNFELSSVGKVLTHVEAKIAEDGEILLRGPNIMKGYWNDIVSTSEAIDEDGWLYTGDIGKFSEKGNLKITDRKKYLLVTSSGKNIAPQPIEQLLCQSQYVDQCFILGDNREFCTALITPDFEQLKKLAETFNIEYENESELISNEKLVKTIKNDIDRLQQDLAKYERVRKFSLLSKPFSIENGELTPKLSVRRHVVERNYSYLIEQMYGMD